MGFLAKTGGSWTGSNYNSSDKATTTGGANDRTSQTFTFVDSANGDFHLASTDAGAKDYGTDLSGDANCPVTDDIDGVTRSGTWDIGADEYVAPPAAGNPHYAYMQQ